MKRAKKISARLQQETDRLLQQYQNLNVADPLALLQQVRALQERCRLYAYRAPEAQLLLATHLRSNALWQEALECCEALLPLVNEADQPDFYCRLRAEYMRAHLGTNRVDDYLRVTIENVALFEKHQQTLLLATTYLHLCRIHYYYLKNDEQALHFAEKAIAIGRPITQLEALRVVVQLFTYSHQTEKAMPYLQRALQLAREQGEMETLMALEMDEAFAYRELRQFEKAIPILKRIAALPQPQLSPPYRASVLSGLSDCYQQTGQLPLFETTVNRALKLLPQVPNPQHYNVLCQAAINYHAAGQHQRAYELHTAFHRQYRQYFVEERDKQVSSLKATFEKEQAERQLQLLRLKNQALENEVAARQREMNLLATYLLERNKAMDEFLQQVKVEVSKLEQEQLRGWPIGDLLKRLTEGTQAQDDMQQIDEQVLRLNRSFMEKLSARFPMLNATELRVCALVAAELPNKSIALILRISHRTIETHRLNIQRKIGLPKGQKLLPFLRSMQL